MKPMKLALPDREVRKAISRAEFERMADAASRPRAGMMPHGARRRRTAPAELDAVVLVGGSTRIPLVRRRVAELFGREPLCSLDPDQVVALGAAVQAGVLMGSQGDMLLLDVVPLSLGIETMGGVMERLIHRNTTIPTSVTEMFTTAVDNQTHVDIHVVQGERELAADCRIARALQAGADRDAAGRFPRVQVTFLMDANGILNVTARDQRTGRRAFRRRQAELRSHR